MKIRRLFVAAALLVAVAGTACANPGYDPGSTRQELVDAGLTPTQSACVVRLMERQFREQRLEAHDVLRGTERKRFKAILHDCHVDVTKGGAGSS